MFGLDNANPDTAEIIFAVALFLGVLAAVAYAVGSRPVQEGRIAVGVWGPVLLSLAVAALGLAWWVA